MATQDRLFTLAAKIIRVISLKNVAIWTLASLVTLFSYTVFENRDALVNYVVKGPEVDPAPTPTFSLSETTKNRIKQVVDKDSIIIAVTVLNADIRNNRRMPVAWYSADAGVQRQLEALFGGRYGGLPLFTSDEKNNINLVGIINGEFACAPYNEAGNDNLFPGLGHRFPFICRTSLPPYYGQFSGYVAVALNRVPTTTEIDAIKASTLSISTEIYLRDILPESKRNQN